MVGARRIRILGRLAETESPGRETARLCDVCAEVTGVTGAAIVLMSEDGPRGSVCTTGAVSALIERLQFELGEGPCVDAYRLAKPVVEADLAEPAVPRWLAFTEPAVRAGVRAVFGFPLQLGAVRLGALNLYADRPGSLSDEQYADALVLAEVAAQAVLLLQAATPPGRLAAELEVDADLHYVVHQASGMVAVQLNVTVGQAFVRLRAYAFGNDRPLAEVARAVVARTLRFGPDEPDSPE